MKPKSKKPLIHDRRPVPRVEPYRITNAPLEQKKENLYAAIERTQAFMHKRPPDEAMALIRKRYPAPLYFLEAGRSSLERAGLGRLDAFYYAMIPSLTRTTVSQQISAITPLDNFLRMAEYLKALYIGVHVECFYAILLNRSGKLIRSALLQRGNINAAPFELSDLLRTALEPGVRFVVIAHNHPGGTRHASPEDLRCTLRALNAFAPLHIPMLDHMIVARGEVFSVRASGLIPDHLWTVSLPNSRIVRGWLDTEEE